MVGLRSYKDQLFQMDPRDELPLAYGVLYTEVDINVLSCMAKLVG